MVYQRKNWGFERIFASDLDRLEEGIAQRIENGENITAGDTVSLSSGQIIKADNSDENKRPAIGVAIETAVAGASSAVLQCGISDGFSGLVADTIYYLGTTGGVVASPPGLTGRLVQQIGIAIDASSMVLRLDPLGIEL